MNLLRHQRAEIPPNKAKRKQFKNKKLDPKILGTQMKLTINKHHTRRKNLKTRKHLIPGRFFKLKTDITNVMIPKILKDFSVLLAHISAEIVINLVFLVACATRKKDSYKKRPRSPKANQLTSGGLSTQNNSICYHSSVSSSSDESSCLQMKVQADQANVKYPAPQHLFTNLEFKVRPCKNKTKFL